MMNTNNSMSANTNKGEMMMNTVNDNVVLEAVLYLEERYNNGDFINLTEFMMDNGILMAATMLNSLCECGVLAPTHDGFNRQEVPEFSYVYMGIDDRFTAGLSAKRMLKDFLTAGPKVINAAKGLFHYVVTNNDITPEAVEDTLNAYWSVWSDFFPGWRLFTGSRILHGNEDMVVCDWAKKRIIWLADTVELRLAASTLGMDWRTYVRVAIAHELGHASDHTAVEHIFNPENVGRVTEVTLKLEKNAWELGRTFVEDAEKEEYELLNHKNMSTYVKLLHQSKKYVGLAMDETSVANNKNEGVVEMVETNNLLENELEYVPAMGETPVAEDNNEGEDKVELLKVLEITSAQKEDPMHLTQYEDAFNYVMKQPGFKGTSKLKEALLVATQEDPNNLIAFLRNPEDFGVAKGSATKYIKPILAEVKLPRKKFTRAKYDQVLTLEFSFDDANISEDLKHIYVDAKYGRRSQSNLLEGVAVNRQVRAKVLTTAGHQVDRIMWDARELVYVEASKKSAALYDAVLKGGAKIYVREPLSEKYFAYEPSIRSASNRRQMQGTLVRSNDLVFGARIELLDKLGSHPATLGFIVDASKDRAALNASNSLGTGLYMGTEVVDTSALYGPDSYGIVGGDFNAIVTSDVTSIVYQGEYQVLDLETKEIVTLNAKDHPISQEITDGSAIAGPFLKKHISALFGENVAGCQFRLAPACKGCIIFLPDFEETFPGFHLLMFESSVKVDIRSYLAHMPVQTELRVMNPARRKKEKVLEASYQMGHGILMKHESYLDIANPVYDAYNAVATDPRAILGLLNKEGLAEQHTMLDKFLSESTLAAKDPYLARTAIDQSKEAMKRIRDGKLPMKAEFKFAMNDVYAIIDAILDMTFEVKREAGIKAGSAITLIKGRLMNGGTDFATGRFPLQSLGEVAALLAPEHEELDQRYLDAIALAEGYFEGFVLYSAHDFLAIKQGGLDYDGDLVMVIIDGRFVMAAIRTQDAYPPVLDFAITKEGELIAGCPWSEEIVPEGDFMVPGVKSQKGFKLEVSEWTREATVAFLQMQDFYDSLTLKPNRIGEFTDYATMLHDALRAVAYETRQAKAASDMDRVAFLKGEADTMLNWMAYLRLIQGYEIDRAKKGGAFEVELKEQLAFMENPGALAYRLGTWETNEHGKKHFKWARPVWMKSGNEEQQAPSVFTMLYKEVNNRIARLTKDSGLLMQRLEKEQEVLAAFSATIPFNDEHYSKLYSFISKIDMGYSHEVRSLMKSRDDLVANQEGGLSEKQEKMFAEELSAIFEKYTDEMDALYANATKVGITKAQFGFYVYKVVQRKAFKKDENTFQGRSFPFRAAAEYVYAAFMEAEGKEARKNYFDVFKGRRIKLRGIRLSNHGVLSERMNGDVAEIQVIDGTPHVVFANGVQVKVFKDHIDTVVGFTGRVKVTNVILPNDKANPNNNNVGLELILG
ncbi:hypothetical protein C0431_13125 [bacterium]|nr:hypothetical protein [bacterium]